MSYLIGKDGNKLTARERKGTGSRANRNVVWEFNKKLHSKSAKKAARLAKLEAESSENNAE